MTGDESVALWLEHWTLGRVVWVLALAGVSVLCSWARPFTLTLPLSTQEYKFYVYQCKIQQAFIQDFKSGIPFMLEKFINKI